MARALELAWRGWGRVQPNPLVGAVVLRDGRWSAKGGTPSSASVTPSRSRWRPRASGPAARRSCARWSRATTRQAAALHRRAAAAGVRRVVAAVADPNPVAAGGAARLRAAGVDVELGLWRDEAAAQNAVFLHRYRDASRPFVALKLATTIDGRIADADGQSRWISGDPAREYVHWLRAGFDAIAVGGGPRGRTIRRSPCAGRVEPRVPPRRVVFAADGDVLDRRSDLVRTARRCRPSWSRRPTRRPERLGAARGRGRRRRARQRPGGGLWALRAAGVDSLLVEGGGRLAGALLAAGLVDRYYWVQSPLWLGRAGVPAVAGAPHDAARRRARAGAWPSAARWARTPSSSLDRP